MAEIGTILNTEMMTLFNKVDNGTATHEQFNKEIGKIATIYGMEVTGQAYIAMLKHCNQKAKMKIENIASGRI